MFLKKKTKALLTNEELIKVQNKKIKELMNYDKWLNSLINRNGYIVY
jgi:hypothetical protein